MHLLLLGLGVLAALMACPVPAQEPATPTDITRDDANRLLETLKDDAKRDAFVYDLETLVAAMDARDSRVQRSAGATLLETVSTQMESLGTVLTGLAEDVADVPGLLSSIARGLSDPVTRAAWVGSAVHIAIILLAGLAARWFAQRLLRRFRHTLESQAEPGIWLGGFFALLRAVLGLVAIAAFVAAAYAAMTLLAPARPGKVLALALINASVIVQVVLLLTRTLLAPDVASLRLLPVSDETANYCAIWIRRLVQVMAYGYFLTGAMAVLGTTPVIQATVVKLVGLTVTFMLVILILQVRRDVARVVRGDRKGLVGQLRRRTADIWHLVAILYIVAIFGVWALDVPGGFEYVMGSTGLTVAVLVVTALLVYATRSALRRLFSLTDEQKARFPGLEARASRYLPLLMRGLQYLLYGAALLAILNVWGFSVLAWTSSPLGTAIIKGAANIVVVILISVVVWEVVSAAIERYLSAPGEGGDPVVRGQRAMTLLPLMRNIVMIALAVLVILTTLSEIGVNIGPLIAGAGILGLAIGFGAQTFVKDVITGFFILVEDAVAVGDIVILAGYKGKVEAISIRSIQLRDLQGDVHRIPFSEVTSTTNRSKVYSFAAFDIGVAYREDVDHCMDVIRDLGTEIRQDETVGSMITEDIEILGVQRFDDSAVVIRARIKVQPGKQLGVERAFNRLLKIRFDREGIEIPFPHHTVYFGVDSTGAAPPARVQLEPPRQGEP